MIDVLYEGPEGWGETAYPGDAGIDLPIVEQAVLAPGGFADLPSGIKVAIPEGYYGRIAARSGALRNRKIRVYEGVIDAGYRGELYSYVENVGKTATVVKPGDRLAQLIIQPVIERTMHRVSVLPESIRGSKGFGSSDKVRSQVIVYAGGPIDFKGENIHDDILAQLRAAFPNVTFFDPKTENAGEPDPQVIWARNSKALNEADIGIFLFDDPATGYGFGSPIEIASLIAVKKRVIVWHNSDNVGVYLRKLWADGMILATDWQDFRRILSEEISKVGNG